MKSSAISDKQRNAPQKLNKIIKNNCRSSMSIASIRKDAIDIDDQQVFLFFSVACYPRKNIFIHACGAPAGGLCSFFISG